MADRDIQAQEHTDDVDSGIMSREEVLAIIAGYEQQFGMTSEEFLRRWKEDTVPDLWETNAWAMLLDWV